jgi:hypothetical protein
MKVTINTHGHCVEIESTDVDMTVHRLANIAINTWRRTAPPYRGQPAFGLTAQLAGQPGGPASFRCGERPDVRGEAS